MPKAQSRVTAYKATDGALFEDKAKYKEYQAGLNVMGGLRQIGDRINTDSRYFCEDSGFPLLTANDFGQFVLDNAEDIQLALAGKPIPDRVKPVDQALAAQIEQTASGSIPNATTQAAMAEARTINGSPASPEQAARLDALDELAPLGQELGLYEIAAPSSAPAQ